MVTRSVLVGRRDERRRLEEALQQARLGSGSLVLVAGDAGVGKTRLVDHLSGESAAPALWGRARQGAATPYGPVVSALRSLLRLDAQSLDDCGPLRAQLALILPELGEPARESDRPALFEAVHAALGHIAREAAVVVVLDDLQWSDEATLELLPALAESVSELQLLIVAIYRSDGLPREHPLRRVRHELRRSGRLTEIIVPPLSPPETAELLTLLLEQPPAPSLVGAGERRPRLGGGADGRAVAVHRDLDLPFTRAEIELRAGVALAAAGEREPALDLLGNAYRTARKLGARPLAAEATREVASLGESVAQRLGSRAAAHADGPGLTRREHEVVRLVAVGRTNREIATELFLSPRTVDMHLRNLLRKLDCRSRVEAAHRAGKLDLLA